MTGQVSAQRISLSDNDSAPHISSIVDISSTSGGLLPPRMTKGQRDSISNPIAGLMIWCNNCIAPTGEMQVFNGSKWTNMTGGISPTNIVNICSQVWSTKNLDVDRYRNGDPIPKVTDPAVWATLTTGAYCYYNNDSTNYAATYGKLYNWYALDDPRGLAPNGWHLPSMDELFSLLNICLDGEDYAGGPLKETGYVHWYPPNADGSNSTGFTALPGGGRDINGAYFGIGSLWYTWASTEQDDSYGFYILLTTNSGGYSWDSLDKRMGFTLRCIRD